MGPPPLLVSGGVTAYHTGPRLREAVRSLLSQELPEGCRWSYLWVVVSGEGDDTLDVAEGLAREDPRVRVVHQKVREGKASALGEIFRRADGAFLVLLNGDATASPGSVGELLAVAGHVPGPLGVMGKPCVPDEVTGGLARGTQVLWELHHQLHRSTLSSQRGNHLSDELWLLSLPLAAPLPCGVVNDGSFVGAWLHEHGGRLLYAPRARVFIEVPRTPAEHLRQRRRIHWGHRQVRQMLGVEPTTWNSYGPRHPGEAARLFLRTARGDPRAVAWTAFFGLLEVQAMLLAGWDRHVVRRDHVLWEIVPLARSPSTAPVASGPAEVPNVPRTPRSA